MVSGTDVLRCFVQCRYFRSRSFLAHVRFHPSLVRFGQADPVSRPRSGTTAQEIIASSIFLFIKHAYDVGDKVEIDGLQYVVLE